jgi:hypothetical protein
MEIVPCIFHKEETMKTVICDICGTAADDENPIDSYFMIIKKIESTQDSRLDYAEEVKGHVDLCEACAEDFMRDITTDV